MNADHIDRDASHDPVSEAALREYRIIVGLATVIVVGATLMFGDGMEYRFSELAGWLQAVVT